MNENQMKNRNDVPKNAVKQGQAPKPLLRNTEKRIDMNDFLVELAALMRKHNVIFEVEPDFHYGHNGDIIPEFTMHTRFNTRYFEKSQFREIARCETITSIEHEDIKQVIRRQY